MARKGKNRAKCKKYADGLTRAKNKARKIGRHIHLIELKQLKRLRQMEAGKKERWFKRLVDRREIKSDNCAEVALKKYSVYA
jgi:hypothetical protein